MATKKITDLVEITTAASDDVLPIVDVSLDITNKITTTNLLKGKQDLLESGTNIKTINSTSLLGSGDVAVQETLVSGTNIKTINSTSLLGSGDISISANPSGGAGAIQFSDGSAFASDSNLFWDDTNKRLGVGTNTPSARIHVKGTGSTSATTSLLVQNSSNTQIFKVEDGGVVQIGRTDFINWKFSSNTLTSNNYAFIVSNNGTIISTGALNGGVHGNNNGGKVSDSGIAVAQVASAVLEVSSTTRGFLPPRMTTTQKNAISSPAAGLQVYDTTLNQMSYYNGSSWINF